MPEGRDEGEAAMKVEARTVKNTAIHLNAPLSLCINREEDVPADSLAAVFAYTAPLPELMEITVTEGEETVFHGIVDEQSLVCSGGEIAVEISARSMAALLLDNEARPQSYDRPGAADIFRRHILPLGLTEYCCGIKERPARFEILKGMSQWQALSLFCRSCLDSVPAVTPEGCVLMCGYKRGEEPLCFGGKGGRPYTEACIKIKRCKRLSRVFVKTSAGQGYDMIIEDSKALRGGVKRERFLNASDPLSVPVSRADIMLENGRKHSFEITLTCPGRMTAALGRAAQVEARGEIFENLQVSGLQYKLLSGAETTTLVLNRIKEDI